MNNKQISKVNSETNAHFIFRNICAIVTVLIAIYFLYNFLEIGIQAHNQNQFLNNLTDEYASDYFYQGLEEVLLEDYGFSMPSFNFSDIFNIILLILCVVSCVLSNIVNGHFVPFYRTSVISTAIVIVVQFVSSTPLKLYVPAFVSTVIMGTDVNLKSIRNINDDFPQSLIYMGSILLALLLALIPAKIARKKNRSFTLFYVFGYFLFLPALGVSICIGDKYDDQKLSGRGILAVLGIIITIFLTKVFLTPIDSIASDWSSRFYPQLTESEGITGMLLAVVALELALSFILALTVALIVTKLLKKPVHAIVTLLKGNRTNTTQVNYIGKNANYVCQLSRALPIAKKYKGFFERRDRLAKYKKLDIDNVMAMALPITLFSAMLLQFIYKNTSMYLPLPWDRYVFPWKVYSCVVLGIFTVSCILAKPIAVLKCKKAQKLDEINEKKGYLQSIRRELPDFNELPDEDIRYKTLQDMHIIFRFGADHMAIADAKSFASLAKEGKAMAKIIAIAAIPIVVAKAANDYANDFSDN